MSIDTILKEKPWFKEILNKPELQHIDLINLYVFYLTGDNMSKVLPIITSNSNISIRVLDWFVTNYSKKFNVIYEINSVYTDDKYFNVYLQYKCQLKSHKKKLFDPFCRKQRIAFHYDNNKCVVTTIGQLNFFRWAIEYGVLSYVESNLQAITNDMIISNKQIVKKYNDITIETNSTSVSSENIQNNISTDTLIITSKSKNNKSASKNTKSETKITNSESTNTDSEKKRKKRHELSTSANKTINIHNYSIVLSFD
jgi:hypothetical protein